MKNREDLDLTTIVDLAFKAWLEANSLSGMMGALPPAKIEAMKRVMVAPNFHAIPHIIAALDETPADADEDTLWWFHVCSYEFNPCDDAVPAPHPVFDSIPVGAM